MQHRLACLVAIAWSFGVLLCSSPGHAQTYPDVTQREPFMPESNYMSLYGYLRWQYFLSCGRCSWRSATAEAKARQEFERKLKAKV